MIAETASANTTPGGIERSLANAPTHIRRAVDRARARAGLPPLRAAERDDTQRQPAGRGPGVYWDPNSRHRPRGGRPGLLRVQAPPRTVDRVLIVTAHGVAAARDVGHPVPEWIRPDAFGRADQLNAERGWSLRAGHDGPAIALAGPALRAHDTPVGLVLEWLPAPGSSCDQAILSRLRDRPAAASVKFSVRQPGTGIASLPEPTRVVRKARLLHVAILADDERPAYPGAVAIAFAGRPVGEAELARQIQHVVAVARRRAAGG